MIRKIPSMQEFTSYCLKNGIRGFGKPHSELYSKIVDSEWKMADGSTPDKGKNWTHVTKSWYKVFLDMAQHQREENKKMRSLEKAKKRDERRKKIAEALKGYYRAYTDGSWIYSSKNKEGGSAYVILKDGVPIHEAKKGLLNTTNQRAELLAIVSVAAWLPSKSSVMIYTDSRYCINILSGLWEAKCNLDLVSKFNDYAQKLSDVMFRWVKGHSGNVWNEYVDKLATEATLEVEKTYGLPLHDFSDRCKTESKKLAKK